MNSFLVTFFLNELEIICLHTQCVNLLNMFIKHDFKLEMFVAVGWSYDKWCISIVMPTVPLIDCSVVKVWILALLYELTPRFVEIFFRFKKLTCMAQFMVILFSSYI